MMTSCLNSELVTVKNVNNEKYNRNVNNYCNIKKKKEEAKEREEEQRETGEGE